MDRLQRLSELAQIQAKFMPQMEAVQAVYQAIPPKTLSRLRQISVSPTYRYLLSLPAHQIERAAEAARITQDAEVLMNSFLLAFEKLSDKEQNTVIDAVSSIEIPKAVFEQVMNETTPSENHSFRPDVPCAANILPKDIDSTWMQIRKAMYPIVHGNLSERLAVCGILSSGFDASDPMLKNLFLMLSVVIILVAVAGDPDKASR